MPPSKPTPLIGLPPSGSRSTGPVELPLVTDRHERGDAAANRRRILAAARALLEAHGPAGVSMDAVAARAGVGKGTVFRRFGDRAGLIGELVNEYMRDFLDAFLTGPPPLGPGAPPADRLVAFLSELIELQQEHLPIALAVELSLPPAPDGAYSALRIHTATLIHQINPALDSETLASMVLGAVAPSVLHQLNAGTAATVDAMIDLVSGILNSRGPDPGVGRASRRVGPTRPIC